METVDEGRAERMASGDVSNTQNQGEEDDKSSQQGDQACC